MRLRWLRGNRDADEYAEIVAAVAEVQAGIPPDDEAVAAAFFDLDNTVLQGASLFYLARGLARRDFFRTRDLLRFAIKELRYRRGAEDDADIQQARSAALAFIADRKVQEISHIAEEVFEESMEENIWPGTRAISQVHLEQGQQVWLVTAAPAEVATVFAQRLGMTGALGTVAEHVDGFYTGRLVGDLLHGEAKAAAIRALASREGLQLELCSAYSDSINDIPMLNMVGHPCAVNPDRALLAHARRHNWRIRDYRRRHRVAMLGRSALAGALAGAAVGAAVATRRRL
ncbi:MAG TPA: HAD family phosphatase [Jiangellaceae bacterium]|nr:HAD family phosphatase [Jiangellaceae bacterium]